jgi:hypothetical protein
VSLTYLESTPEKLVQALRITPSASRLQLEANGAAAGNLNAMPRARGCAQAHLRVSAPRNSCGDVADTWDIGAIKVELAIAVLQECPCQAREAIRERPSIRGCGVAGG